MCIKLVNYWDKYTEMHDQQNVKISLFVSSRYILSLRRINFTHTTPLICQSLNCVLTIAVHFCGAYISPIYVGRYGEWNSLLAGLNSSQMKVEVQLYVPVALLPEKEPLVLNDMLPDHGQAVWRKTLSTIWNDEAKHGIQNGQQVCCDLNVAVSWSEPLPRLN